MIQQVTKNIKISIDTIFRSTFYENNNLQYAFEYKITIENQSKDSVQLDARHWNIIDALNDTETVSGEGVIGFKPILNPGELHTYKSGCILNAPFGAMSGYYNMINLNASNKFKVYIPSFKLIAPFAIN